jgi:VWFA-related protein
VISAIDPNGLEPHVDVPGAGARGPDTGEPGLFSASHARWERRLLRQGSLQDLANGTGGIAVTNQNDTAGGLARLLDDQRSYYLIGFEPGPTTFELDAGRPRFRKVELTVKRKDLVVRTRGGFYGISDEELARARGGGPG